MGSHRGGGREGEEEGGKEASWKGAGRQGGKEARREGGREVWGEACTSILYNIFCVKFVNILY